MAFTLGPASLWLIIACLSNLASAADGYPSEAALCLYSCQTAVGTFSFASPKGVTYEEPRCQNSLSIRSTYLCGEKYCSKDELEEGTAFLQSTCKILDFDLPGYGFVTTLTHKQFEQISIVHKGDKTQFNRTIIPDEKVFRNAYNSNDSRRRMKITDDWLACSQYIFWATVVLFGMCQKIHNNARRALSTPLVVDEARASPSRSQTLAQEVQKIASLSLFGSVPSAAAAVMVFYFIFVILLCALGYSSYFYPTTIIYKPVDGQIASLIGRRIANITLANLPLVWLFALRNNPLIFMTDWDFNTFNFFHKWLGRITALAAISHGIAFTKFEFIKGGATRYASMFKLTWWNAGISAVLLFATTVAFSNRFIRQKIYDVFIVVHIALAAAIIALIYIHVRNFNNTFVAYIWVPVGLWITERALRAARIAFLIFIGRSVSAHVNVDADANIVRIDATNIVGRFMPYPGGHYFLYTPKSIFFWQSHPFTLVQHEHKPKALLQQEKKHVSSVEATAKETEAATLSSITSEDKYSVAYSFVISPHDGFTKRLMRTVQCHGGSCTMPVLLEGPYGARPPVQQYEFVQLIVAGSGISVGTSATYAALAAAKVRQVRFIWVVRSVHTLRSIVRQELQSALEDARFRFDAYVTGAGPSSNEDAGGLKIAAYSRPDVSKIVQDMAIENTVGRTALISCGPKGLADDIHAAVMQACKRGAGRLDFYNENFCW